ncbi:hypothetical protein PLESTB_001583600 [Pleodorina starrii]|uniref:BACK domain-containing protein n=1 Tax=Pleodorina starrii TaxID=330485 RepID=A0A9W6F8C0_9CHLO|nr:hypothetical protein PLESTM_000605400 [Pleodorina starrii]GLC60192.1 hypothetical protein PLESTB_001583600 [Pleodorina starrii]GLC77571.1 hypothetical protein PLESTF_001956500 [Pleodorina starrii]
MSSSVHGWLSGLFGTAEQSDCTIELRCRQVIKPDPADGEPANKRPKNAEPANGAGAAEAQQMIAEGPVCDQLPAHLIVICGGSVLFRAQAAYMKQHAHHPVVFRVLVNNPEEAPFVRSAVRFMYTGKLEVNGAEALLRVRRIAGKLQIAGCVAACDAELTALTNGTGPSPAGAHPLTGVADLFTYRALLPTAPEARAAVDALLDECRKALVRYAPCSTSSGSDAPIVPGGPGLGELLAWAFRDAPSLLSDPVMRRQMCALPEGSMEALLASSTFATDDEASVLLMLAHWLHAHEDVNKATRKRLCKQIRVCQLSDTYLLVVLPELPWFKISPEEYRFICVYTRSSAEKREFMRKITAQGSNQIDTACSWYAAVPRPWPGTRAVAGYDWRVQRCDMKALLGKSKGEVARSACFGRKGASEVVSRGFEWRIEISWLRGSAAAGVHLWCDLPKVLGVSKPEESLVDVVCPGPVEVSVFSWNGAAIGSNSTAAAAAGGSSTGAAAAGGSNTGAAAAGGSGTGTGGGGGSIGTAAGGSSTGTAAGGSTGAAAAAAGGSAASSVAATSSRVAGGVGGVEVVWSASFENDFVRIGCGMGESAALPLAVPDSAATAAQQQPMQEPSSPPQKKKAASGAVPNSKEALHEEAQLAAWAPYLHEGRLHGVLRWNSGAGQ